MLTSKDFEEPQKPAPWVDVCCCICGKRLPGVDPPSVLLWRYDYGMRMFWELYPPPGTGVQYMRFFCGKPCS